MPATDRGAPLIRFAVELGRVHPDALFDLVRETAETMGGRDVELWLSEVGQRELVPVGGDDTPVTLDASAPGQAFRLETMVTEQLTDRVRLWLPVIDSADRLGVLGVVVAAGETDVELWQGFAAVLGETLVSKIDYGDGLNRARRTRAMSLAAELRWAMLPPLTFTIPEVDVTGLLEPAYEIAGDTFDYGIDGNTLRMTILDAMGHGLEASQLANLAVGTYRNCRRDREPLASTVRRIDDVVAEQFGDHRFVTGQLAQLMVATGELTILNAGHPRPLLFRTGTAPTEVPCAASPPLGLGDVRTETTEMQLRPGDAILFHSDGVADARASDDSVYGADRLVTGIAAGVRDELPPAEILRQVIHDLRTYSDDRLRDDATLLFVRWHGPAGEDRTTT